MRNDAIGGIDGAVKKDIEHIYQSLRISLSEAGAAWKRGESSPWYGFDVRANPANTLLQYQKLVGTLRTIYSIAVRRLGDRRGIPTSDPIPLPPGVTRAQALSLAQKIRNDIQSSTGELLTIDYVGGEGIPPVYPDGA